MDFDEILHLYSEEAALDSRTLDYWSTQLLETCLVSGTLSFSIKDCAMKFTKYDIVPAYFEKSVQELRRKAILISESDLSVGKSIDFLSLAFGALMSRLLPSSAESNVRYLHVQILDDLCTALSTAVASRKSFEMIFSSREPTFHMKTFLQSIVNTEKHQKYVNIINGMSEQDLQLVLAYFAKKKLAIVENDLVYFVSSSVESFSQTNGKIPENILSVLKIRQTILDIEQRIHSTEEKVSSYTVKAKGLKLRGDNNGAMLQLKLRKNCQNLLQKLQQAHFSLEESLQTIEGMEANQLVISAYQAAANALHSTRVESGLTIDSVESAVDLFQSELEETQQIGTAIAASSSLGAVEDAELEEELNELMELADRSPNLNVTKDLPDAPKHSVESSATLNDVEAGRIPLTEQKAFSS